MAQYFRIGDLRYYIMSSNSVAVNDCNTSATVVNIPATVTHNGTTYNVTSIENMAFEYCSGLTSITIPNSVTSIGDRAFYGCSSLTSASIGDAYAELGSEVNFGRDVFGCIWWLNLCTNLTTVNINKNIVGSRPFAGTDITNVTIGNSVTEIKDSLFYDCNSLASITIPNSVMWVGSAAFSGCSGLTSATIGSNVISIGSKAFNACAALSTVSSLATNPPMLNSGAFDGCYSLSSLTVPCGSLAAYSTGAWNYYFANRISEDGSVNVDIEAEIAEGETYTDYGFNESEAGVYTRTIESETACDSIITLILTVTDAPSSLLGATADAVELTVYPNPARGYATLELGEAIEETQVLLFDIRGRRVREYPLARGAKSLQIDLTGLPSGVYTLRVGSSTRKLTVE